MVRGLTIVSKPLEHLICNQGVTGSSPVAGTIYPNKINVLCESGSGTLFAAGRNISFLYPGEPLAD